MARTTVNVKYSMAFDSVEKTIRNILTSSGYKEIDYNGETVWKKGTGLLTAMHYIKVEYSQDSVAVSGWVQNGIGNVGGNEISLDGAYLAVPKKSVMKTITRIQNEVK